MQIQVENIHINVEVPEYVTVMMVTTGEKTMSITTEFIGPIARCEHCERELTNEEIEYPYEDEPECCEDCYCERQHFTCCLCQEHDDKRVQHRLVVIVNEDEELDNNDLAPGIYRVLRRPYATQPMVGSGWIEETSVSYLAPLPPHIDTGDYPCGHLCRDCQEHYTMIGDETE
jgi:hypothetical protein